MWAFDLSSCFFATELEFSLISETFIWFGLLLSERVLILNYIEKIYITNIYWKKIWYDINSYSVVTQEVVDKIKK